MDLRVFLSNGTTGHVTCRLAMLQGRTMPQFVLMNKTLYNTQAVDSTIYYLTFSVTLESGS